MGGDQASGVSDFYDDLYRGWYSSFEGGIEVRALQEWQPGKLLDVGCGKGMFLKAAADRGFEVCGIDVSPVALEMAARAVPAALLTLGEAEELPFEGDSFDYVTCLGSLEHFADRERSIREMVRVLKAGGRAYVSLPSSHHLEAVVNSARYGLSGHDGQVVEHLATYNQWREMLEENGLRVVKVTKFNKRPPLRPFRTRNAVARLVRPFIPLNLSYLFEFECTPDPGRAQDSWRCELSLTRGLPWRLERGESCRFVLRVRNTGFKLWLTPDVNLFPVNLGWMVKDGAGGVTCQGRCALKKPVRPGESRRISGRLTAPDEPGDYEVSFDMLREGDFWFQQRGNSPVTARVTIT